MDELNLEISGLQWRLQTVGPIGHHMTSQFNVPVNFVIILLDTGRKKRTQVRKLKSQ